MEPGYPSQYTGQAKGWTSRRYMCGKNKRSVSSAKVHAAVVPTRPSFGAKASGAWSWPLISVWYRGWMSGVICLQGVGGGTVTLRSPYSEWFQTYLLMEWCMVRQVVIMTEIKRANLVCQKTRAECNQWPKFDYVLRHMIQGPSGWDISDMNRRKSGN
jgi:hypothetical protein